MGLKQINGVNLYYEQAGSGDTTLLLIHGNVGSSRWWEPVWEQLAKSYTVVRADLRGCGQSEKPGVGNSVPQYSADMRALIRELGLKNVVVVGHSLGGAVTMDMVVTEPELMQGMVLICSAPAEGFVTPEERHPLIAKMIEDRNLMKMSLAAVIPTAAQGEFFERLVDDAMIAGPTCVPNYQSLGQVDYREGLKKSEIPALVVSCALDSLITLDMLQRTADVIPNSELLVYDGIGHSPMVEAPEQLVTDLKKFVNQVATVKQK